MRLRTGRQRSSCRTSGPRPQSSGFALIGTVLPAAPRCLQSDDDRVAMMAAQAILDRAYGTAGAIHRCQGGWPDGSLLRRDASQGRDHRGVAQGQCGVPISVDQTGGRSLISWDRYSDIGSACMLVGSHLPRPGIDRGKVPVPDGCCSGSDSGQHGIALGTRKRKDRKLPRVIPASRPVEDHLAIWQIPLAVDPRLLP